MNKICTSLEQSKKLIELGIDVNSADMYYSRADVALGEMESYPNILHCEEIGDDIPCWSLAALLGVLPIVYINNKKEICGPLHIDITDSETPFVLWYVNPLHKGSIVELKTKEYDNMIDACHEMIVKLKEKNLL